MALPCVSSTTARPEDITIHPQTKDIYIAYTDGAPGSNGYPDSRIFVISKYSEGNNSPQPSGAIFRITEDSADGTGTTFRWKKFVKGSEAGTEPGDSFAI